MDGHPAFYTAGLKGRDRMPIPLDVMPPGTPPRRRRGALALIVLACACAVVPASAQGAPGRPGDGELSPRLAELAKPAMRSASPAKQARALSLAPDGPGSLVREGNRILIEVRFDRGAAAGLKDLRAAGAKVVSVAPRYQAVTVAAKPPGLPALGDVPRIASVRPVLQPIAAASECPSGAVVSEGVEQIHAGDEPAEARENFGVNGAGITVGVLSDSFNQATKAGNDNPIATREDEDVENGDLPGPTNTCGSQSSAVQVLDDSETKGADEGRAMAQIVHDVSPESDIAFATAFTPDMFGFAKNIEELAESSGTDADVIVNDVFFFEEPFFQAGPVASAVERVTEDDDVAYLSAAGNSNVFDSSGNEIGSWEAEQFRDAGSCPPAIIELSEELEAAEGFGLEPTHCLDFHPGTQIDKTFGIKVAPGGTLSIDLQWAEPWYGVDTDIDVFLLNSAGNLIRAIGEDNISTQIPFEFLQWENKSASTQAVQLVINRYTGEVPRLKFGLLAAGNDVIVDGVPAHGGHRRCWTDHLRSQRCGKRNFSRCHPLRQKRDRRAILLTRPGCSSL